MLSPKIGIFSLASFRSWAGWFESYLVRQLLRLVFSCPDSLYFCKISGDVTIKQAKPINKNKAKFRRLARQVSGEVFDVPEDDLILFCYKQEYTNSVLVGQISFSLSDLRKTEPASHFTTDYFSHISFLFVHKDFQCIGYGKMLMEETMKIIRSHDSSRPIRVQAADEAVPFFEKLGFCVVGEPIKCVHSGSRLFRTIVNMELCQRWQWLLFSWKIYITCIKTNNLSEMWKDKAKISMCLHKNTPTNHSHVKLRSIQNVHKRSFWFSIRGVKNAHLL